MTAPATSGAQVVPVVAAVAAQLCFGSVRHERLRPAPNRFCYGVYFLRLPLRQMANDGSGNSPAGATAGRATAGAGTGITWSSLPQLFSHNRFNLLAFHDCDHGDGHTPLTTWIDALLAAEGIDDADGEVWLQAFPRVLGYVFNPVSFWFCHRRDGRLRAIVCEVRNTFGEKHCYLLDTGATMAYGVDLRATKVFHVSPFCAVEGGYRFRFMRTAASADTAERTVARIDHDDATGPLLLTSINGTAAALSNRHIVRAFFGYPLMTFGVMLKIHWQALRLWLKRVPFFSKPVPPTRELSR